MGIDKVGESERYSEHLSELQTRVQMINAAINWLENYKEKIKDDKKLLLEVSVHIYEYRMLKKTFESRILEHDITAFHDEQTEIKEKVSLLLQVIEVEKEELTKLWREEKINLRTRNKLLAMLDHQVQRHLI